MRAAARARGRHSAARLLGLTALVATLAASAAAAAQQQAPAAQPPHQAAAPADAEHRLVWKYPRFRLIEYAAAGAVTAGNFTLESVVTDVPDNDWTGGILFDDVVRDALRARSYSTRRGVSAVSDVVWNVTQYYPVIVDGLFVPLVTDRLNVDVAWQMTMLNWQAQSLAFLFTRIAHRTVGRRRPEVLECDQDPLYTGACSPDSRGRTASFFSGHASMSFVGAGLTCAHHRALPLYGGNAADAAICGLSLASATTVGVMRLVVDAHWASDVLVGAAVGATVGYGLPNLLHYGAGSEDGASLGVLPRNVAIAPLATPTVTGIAVMGLF